MALAALSSATLSELEVLLVFRYFASSSNSMDIHLDLMLQHCILYHIIYIFQVVLRRLSHVLIYGCFILYFIYLFFRVLFSTKTHIVLLGIERQVVFTVNFSLHIILKEDAHF